MLGDKEEAIEEEERSTNESSLSLDEEEEEEEDRCLFFCCCCFCFLRALIVLCTAVNSLNFCKVKAQTPRAKERPATDGAPLPTESSAFTLADGCNRDACQLGIHKQWKERSVSLYSFVFVPNEECLKKKGSVNQKFLHYLAHIQFNRSKERIVSGLEFPNRFCKTIRSV